MFYKAILDDTINIFILCMTTVVSGLEAIFADSDMRVTICSMNGVVLFRNTTVKEAAPKLKPGLYIVNGRKMVVK